MKLNPNAIPGIHNYCDRWCERCPFTSRCNVFENKRDLTPEEQDISNKAFWDKLSNQFKDTGELLRRVAAEHGFDFASITPEEQEKFKSRQDKLERKTEENPLSRLSRAYSKAAMTWLKTTDEMREKEKELNQHLALGILPEKDGRDQAATLKDCLEIIEWYVHFIPVKFGRAITGKLEDDSWEKENGYQNDFDGSAKIALIAVERSIQAWSRMYQSNSLKEDEFLNLASLLAQIKVSAEKEFPNAHMFIRPGFDEQ
jgi:hypothetical protein